jgi:AraC-like ligand binding domain
MTGEWSRFYRQPALHDPKVLHARFVEHRFTRHSHDYYVIGYVESGVQAFSYQGARHITPPGHAFLVNPGEPHTGEAATPAGYVYRTVYPRATLMQSLGAEVVHGATSPFSRALSFGTTRWRYLWRVFTVPLRTASRAWQWSHIW